jgi:AraC family transcriptional regulator of adaptative response/methylated-DNA-[protein]-cysteine methyltransferase
MPAAHTNSRKPASPQTSDLQLNDQPNDDQRWKAVAGRDSAHDGDFVFAVATTGVYCRPSCPARRPRRENVTFFSLPEQAEEAGFRACLRCRPRSFSGNPQSDSAKEICRYIEQHLDEPITLDHLGKAFRQSPFHLQRRFKAALGITPREYADSCRLRLLKRNLQAGDNVTRAMYDAGYGSSSRLYEKTSSQLGMTPDKYRRGAIAASIRYACADSPLGRMLIAATDRGVCSIQFARSDGELIEGLKREFPFAVRKPDDGGLQAWIAALLSKMTGRKLNAALPLDIRATAFQRRVWTYLPAQCQPGRRSRLRDESGRSCDSLPSRGPRRWQHQRLSLGCGTQENAAGDGAGRTGSVVTHLPGSVGASARATTAQFTNASAIVATKIRDWPKSTRVTRITHRITPSTAKKFPAGRWNIALAPSGCLRRKMGKAVQPTA